MKYMDLIKVIFRMLLVSGWVKYKAVFILLGITSSIFVGWLDYVTTDEINLSFLYLIPVFIITIATGRAAGLFMALTCAIIKIVTDVYADQPYAHSVYYAFNGACLFLAFGAFSILLDSLRSAYGRECELLSKDKLTGLQNRAAFLARTAQNDAKDKPPQTFSFLYVDIDNFKEFNLKNGHHVGDLVLQAIAVAANNGLNNACDIFRVGGDGFAVVIENASELFLRQVAERLHQKITAYLIKHCWQLTVSICVVTQSSTITTLDELLCQAEIALQQGPGYKEGNRIIGITA